MDADALLSFDALLDLLLGFDLLDLLLPFDALFDLLLPLDALLDLLLARDLRLPLDALRALDPLLKPGALLSPPLHASDTPLATESLLEPAELAEDRAFDLAPSSLVDFDPRLFPVYTRT